MSFISQSLVLFLSLFAPFMWQRTSLSSYTTQVIGLLVILYLLLFFIKKTSTKYNFVLKNESTGIFFLTAIVLFLILSTSSISSMFFFLLYFLSFGIAFILDPKTVFSFAIGIIIIFLPEALREETVANLIKLGSLLLISPIAFMFGEEYRKKDKEEEYIKTIEEINKKEASTISKDIEIVLKDQENNLKINDRERLNDALEKANILKGK